MIKTVSINLRPDDNNSLDLINKLILFFQEEKIKILLPDYDIFNKNSSFKKFIVPKEKFIALSDLVIAIGGDGTFLRTSRLFIDQKKPIFGINRGTLGFLTEFSPEESIKHLKEIIKGNYKINERTVFEAVLLQNNREVKKISFINDAVISKGAFSRAIKINLEINDNICYSYSGDGLIISTPTGSTAYSLSAGGPIISPGADNIFLVNPVCPHSLSIRPMLLPANLTVKAKILTDIDNLLLTIDGQESMQIKGNDEILFRIIDKKIKLIAHPDKNFYLILKEKLGWG